MKLDLHSHTFYSDGTASPQFLVQRAVQNQVTHLAITDHDCAANLDGVEIDSALTLISGVEISSQWSTSEIHVVGLFVDHEHADLKALLLNQQKLRRDRVEQMAVKLEVLGIGGLREYLSDLPCVSYTRSHVANFLVQCGAAKSRQKAFNQYLAKGGRAFVPAQWCTLDECIHAINSASGFAVLAHPGRYPLNKKKLELLIADFAIAGGEAIEVRYPNISPDMVRLLERFAAERSLYLSIGSDFHDPAAQWTDVGKVPPLSGSSLAQGVQHHPRWKG